MMKPAKSPVSYIQAGPGDWSSHDVEVIVEAPVSLTINGQVWLTFMCTPVDIEAMAIGFLFNEGVIQTIDEVASVYLCASGDNVDVWLHHSAEKPEKWRRTSGCTGGFTAVEESTAVYPTLNGAMLPAFSVNHLIGQLFEAQQLYRDSGGVHTSALSDGESIIVAAEDIGRHNTLDKLAGRMLLEAFDLPRKVILSTGRISSEMLQKSARMGASVVISRTSPSSLSITSAQRLGITLIGYARRNRFNIYTHPERIVPAKYEGSHQMVNHEEDRPTLVGLPQGNINEKKP